MLVRLDKWLHVARAFKTRSRATRACGLGRIRVNGVVAKAHRRVEVGDEIRIESRDWERVLKVRVLRDRPVRKAEAPDLYFDLSPPRPERDPFDRLLSRRPVHREPGAGRPSKRERRELERLRRR
jgi:ribosome-associated heat shock protein Hsp15